MLIKSNAIERFLRENPNLSERRFGLPCVGNRTDLEKFNPTVQSIADAIEEISRLDENEYRRFSKNALETDAAAKIFKISPAINGINPIISKSIIPKVVPCKLDHNARPASPGT